MAESSTKRYRKRRNFERTVGCEPVPKGWSVTMRRWLASQTAQPLETEYWSAAVLNHPHGPVRVALESTRAITVADLSQILDHRINRSLGRTVHVVRFLHGGELRYAYDHRGSLTELATLGLRSAVASDGTVVFRLPQQDGEISSHGSGEAGSHPWDGCRHAHP